MSDQEMIRPSTEGASVASIVGLGSGRLKVIDTHIHLNASFSGGLHNEWVAGEGEAFQRDWSETDLLASAAKGNIEIEAAVFVECFNRPPEEEAKWVQSMCDDPASKVTAFVAQIYVQKGKEAVDGFLSAVKGEDGSLPPGLKGARMVFPASDFNAPEACLDRKFLEGLEALQAAGLHWEFCVNPTMAPNLAECCAKFPDLTFVIDHLAHNGNDGGSLDLWGPAIDALGKLPNVYAKCGAVEEWGVPNPEAYMERAIAAFGFDRILYESNWFVSEAMGDDYAKTARMLQAACVAAGATELDLANVFRNNAKKVYRLE